MTPSTMRPPFDRFLQAAEDVARARPEVDPELAREVFLEAATLLDNGLALDGLDEHDALIVVDALCADLTTVDPAGAVRARLQTAPAVRADLHDPDGVVAAFVDSARILQL